MHRPRQLDGQRRGDQSVSLDTIETAKGFSNDPHRKMAFTARPGARMARMEMALIGNFQYDRIERRLKLGSYRLLHVTHMPSPYVDCASKNDVSTCVLARSILECENFRLILGS